MKLKMNGYNFKINFNSFGYSITHKGRIYSNGYKINNMQKAIEFIEYITNNKQTYILNK